jgi:hypothetical protein
MDLYTGTDVLEEHIASFFRVSQTRRPPSTLKKNILPFPCFMFLLGVLHSSSNFIREIRSRRMRESVYVTRIWEITNTYKVLEASREEPYGRPNSISEDSVISKWFLEIRCVGWGLD